MLTPYQGRRRATSANGNDQGYVMITVLGAMLVMSLLVTLTLNYTLQATHAGRSEQDHSAALSAAEAGVDDYIARLNANPTYYATGISTGSATIANGAKYDFKVVNSVTNIQATGQITLESTGTVNGEKRKIAVQLKKPSFLDYLYFTQYETLDPFASGATGTQCDKYRYAGRDPGVCTNIQFAANDTLNGDVYSQDSILINGGAKFLGKFETGWNDAAKKYWVDAATSSNPTFAKGKGYKWLPFPTTNTALKAQAAKPGGGGCLFKGPTRILFKSDGTMDVRSPYSGSTSGCGTYSASSPTQVVNVPVPANNVIFVDDYTGATTGCTGPSQVRNLTGFPIAGDDSLTQGSSSLVYGCNNGDVFVEGWLKGQVTLASANNIIVTGDLRYAGANGSAVGTAIPTASNQTPNAADSSGTDVLGLAAANFVEVYHPIDCTTWNTSTCTAGSNVTSGVYPKSNFQIDAVNVASAHSFIVPLWSLGSPLNQLTVLGGIVQKFRGPVAQSSSGVLAHGYAKNYNYDNRLRYNPPPYLADLASTAWTQTAWAEVKS